MGRAVVSSAVAMLLGATAAFATWASSLRGSASQAFAEAEEGETPAQDAVTQVAELPEATEAHDEHASEDTLGLHENVTLDLMVAAALSASSEGCHCSTGEMRNCGSRCLSRHGSARIDCITSCLDASHHAHWCSQCYARRADCSMNHCFNNCAVNSYWSRCTDCVHSHCG